MLVMRLAGVLVAIAIGAALFAWATTRERRYLLLAGRLVRWALAVALSFFALLILERVLAPLA